MSEIKKPEDYQFTRKEEYDNLYKKLNEREPFSYDLNADALYQQYKDKYIGQGKMAMEDAIGQATAMTGGYGNSYAQTVGNQAYQKSLDNLSGIIPELYQMAYNKYNQEGQDMRNMLSLLGSERDFEYGKQRDAIADEQWNKNYDLSARELAMAEEAWELKKKGYTSPGDIDNTNPSGIDTTSASYDAIAKTAAKYKGNNDALMKYLADQVEAKNISVPEMDTIYADNMTLSESDKAPYMNRTYTFVSDGGVNGFWGIDNDAIIKDQYDTNYTLDELVDAMVASGVDKKEAKSFVKKKQKELGIT